MQKPPMYVLCSALLSLEREVCDGTILRIRQLLIPLHAVAFLLSTIRANGSMNTPAKANHSP